MREIIHRGRLLALTGVVGILIPLVVGCTSAGVPQAEVDALKAQLADKDKQVAAAQKQLADQSQQAAPAPKAGNAIIGAVPNAPPRPAPTATPPGFVAPPPPQPPAPEVKTLFIDVSTVTAGAGESKYNVDADKYCTITGVFKRGMHLVWLMEAYDASTGKELQAADVKDAVVKLPTGETASFKYGRHGATADSPWFWSAAWDIPPDYPLGVMDYEVTVNTKTDKHGTFKVWGADNRAANSTTRLQIVE